MTFRMQSDAGDTVEFTPSPKLWIPWLVFGVLTAAVGVWLLLSRDARLATLAILLSVALLFNGLSELVWASGRRQPWVGYLLGALYLVGGVVVILQPGSSLRVLALVMGVVFVATGLFQAAAAAVERQAVQHWVFLLVLGLITFAAGVALLVWPEIGVRVMAFILGIRVLVFGVVQIAASLALRSLTNP